MGANTFLTEARGSTAQEAFDSAVAAAQYDHGHSGYTGTIAEKSSFKVVTGDPDPDRFDDKWGPAGCIALGDDLFVFFGWASS